MNILGIETSCDETAAAVVAGEAPGRKAPRLLSSVVASQVAMHRPFGGVVPEIASRGHIQFITEVVAQALDRSGVALKDIGAFAATAGPGLPGSLLVGLSAGKALSYLTRRPFIAVNHIEAHIYSAFLSVPDLRPPLLALVVSGGHTELVSMAAHGRFKILGETRDDAAGEAFDKVAKLMSLGYPGGPHVERVAARAKGAVPLPVARMKDGSSDFSFSGLKTAVRRALPLSRGRPALIRGFQNAVIAALIARAREVIEREKARVFVLAGGVAANGAIRRSFKSLAARMDFRLVLPPLRLCTDNAAMVACAGWYMAKGKRFSPLDAPMRSGWRAGENLVPLEA